jgi:hypothetical protein
MSVQSAVPESASKPAFRACIQSFPKAQWAGSVPGVPRGHQEQVYLLCLDERDAEQGQHNSVDGKGTEGSERPVGLCGL